MKITRAAEKRAEEAINLLLTKDMTWLCEGREFDNCFEQGDGDMVVFQIMRRYHEPNNFVKNILNSNKGRYLCNLDEWEKLYQRGLTA